MENKNRIENFEEDPFCNYLVTFYYTLDVKARGQSKIYWAKCLKKFLLIIFTIKYY